MKPLYIFLIALCGLTTVNAQKNYPILTLEEIGATTLVNNDPLLFVVENIGDEPNLALYDLEKKAIKQKFSARLPENPITALLPCDDGLLYLITIKRNPESGEPLFDAIYSFNHKTDQIKKIYTEKEQLPAPKTVAIVHLKLVFSSYSSKEQPRVYNIATNKFEAFSTNKAIRLFFAAGEHNSFVVFKPEEITDEESIPIYVMDREGVITASVGVYDSRMVASTNKEENKMPGFIITNPKYEWIKQAYDNSGFPLSGFSIASHPGLAEKYSKTANLFDIREITTANNSFMAAKGASQLWVYNTEVPNTSKPKTVADEDMAAIEAYLEARYSYTKTPIQSAALNEVFSAKFYSICERNDLGDNAFTESTFIAFAQQNNTYQILLDKSMLGSIVSPDFKLKDEQNSAVFQDALNALYPAGTFDKKHIKSFKKGANWYFIRGESFGKKNGFVVILGKNNKIEGITYSEEIEETL